MGEISTRADGGRTKRGGEKPTILLTFPVARIRCLQVKLLGKRNSDLTSPPSLAELSTLEKYTCDSFVGTRIVNEPSLQIIESNLEVEIIQR